MEKSFSEALKNNGQIVTDYLLDYLSTAKITPDYLREGVNFYVRKGGKRLRPALLFWACELAGGDALAALPAAAAVELMHTGTLVHDDIIDRDNMRRGGLSMHAHFQGYFKSQITLNLLDHLANSIAMLVGDIQYSLAIAMMNDLPTSVDRRLVQWLIHNLTVGWVPEVMSGETLDVQYAWQSLAEVNEAMILDMLDKKTASTFALAGKTGALIGLNKLDLEHPIVIQLEKLCRDAGLAFQLQDDILGIVGDQAELGKPVGSDIREGKKTILVAYVYSKANAKQRKILENILGKSDATINETNQVKQLLIDLGGVDYVHELANKYIESAQEALIALPDHPVKAYFKDWINFMINRSY
ncbi:polyprenyl synthetase family protein [Patescibacteria group bacterium]|nr:polyprenyl synthetase family protein [Patescibacteria group bacterium]